MNLSELTGLFQDQILSVAKRSLGLKWDPTVSAVLGPTLLPQRAYIREGICEGVVARIACLTTHAALPVQDYVGVPFALTMTTDQGTKRLLPLIVTEASSGAGDGAVMAVNLVANDPMWFMGQRRRLRTFLRKDVPQVVEEVFADWITHSPIGFCFTYKWLGVLRDRYPQRAQFIQHPDESDAQFVERLLRAAGIAWAWRPKASTKAFDESLPRLELVLFDDGWRLPPNEAASMVFHRRDGTEQADAVDLLAPVWRWVPQRDTVVSWDYEASRAAESVATTPVTQGPDASDIAYALKSVRIASPHLGDSWDDLNRLAGIQANYNAFRSRCLRGRGGVRTMAPGTYQVVEGFGPFAKLSVEDRSHIIVLVEHFAENSLPAELNGAAQALIGDEGIPEWARYENKDKDKVRPAKSAQRYANLFYCVPRTVPIQPSYVTERDEPRRRRLTGIVMSHDALGEITTDELARTRVRLVGGDAGADTTAWVRHPVPWGGANHGYVTPLRADTEVELDWLGPDRLVVVGSYYNGKTPPPRFDHLGGLPNNKALSGVISRELQGERQQQLRFNDTPGHISVQLGTDDAATQLNIGAIGTPMDQGWNEPRGQGFELRTDARGALRTGEALLISTWKRLRAAGKVMDAAEHQALMKDFADLFSGLGTYAGQHQGTAADVQPTATLASDIAAGAEPTISLTAPGGIASTTPKTLMSYAGVNIDSVAMQHCQVTAGGQYLMNAGNGASFFVHRGDYKAIAHHGKLVLQSQHNDTQIDAAKDLKATAAEKMLFVAKEITWMTTEGAFISLKGGQVTIGGSEPLEVNTNGHHWNGPATKRGDLPTFGEGDLGRTPKLLNPTDASPVKGVALRTVRSDMGDLPGQTDTAGRGTKILADSIQRLKNFFSVPRS